MIFKQRNETLRTDQAKFRVIPAYQSFRTVQNRFTLPDIKFWLVKDQKLLFFKRTGKFLQQTFSEDLLIVKRFVIKTDSVGIIAPARI